MRLYHGSDSAIEKPEITFNTGFSDLGRGFYLTDDCDAACRRALSRARMTSAGQGIVSVYDFDESAIPWIVFGHDTPSKMPHDEFGLRIDSTPEGIVMWANYIMSCRRGETELDGLGEPSVVRAWIATEEIEMVCSGFVTAHSLAEFVTPEDLIIQYCFRNQRVLDKTLVYTDNFQAADISGL